MNTYKNLDETLAFATRLSQLLQPGDVLLFQGDLGAGKSTLIRKMIQTLAGEEVEVPSPTFTLVQTYDVPGMELWHFDLYRLEDPEEVHELGIEDAFHQGVSFIEWPERLGYLTPNETLTIHITHGDDPNERHITLKPSGKWADRLKGLA